MADFAMKSPDVDARQELPRAPLPWSNLTRYGLAPVAIAVALAARVALQPILQDEAPYLFFLPAVLVAAGLGGLGSGLLATALQTRQRCSPRSGRSGCGALRSRRRRRRSRRVP